MKKFSPSNLRKGVFFLLVICMALMALTVDAFADPKRAKTLAKEAGKAYTSGDYDTAIAKFSEAYTEDDNPALLYNMGRAYENKADFRNAIDMYLRFVSSPEVDQDARADAMERIRTLKDVIELQGGGIAVAAAPVQSAGVAAPQSSGGCIDINTANEAALVELVSIGPSKAKKIIALRTSKGAFKDYRELTEVPGIAEKTLAKFQHQLCPIGGGAAPKSIAAQPVAAKPLAAEKAKPAPKKEASAVRNIPTKEQAILDI